MSAEILPVVHHPHEEVTPLSEGLEMDLFSNLPEGTETDDGPMNKRMKQQVNEKDVVFLTPAEPAKVSSHKRGDKTSKGQETHDSGEEPESRTLSEILKELGQEAKDLNSTWSQSFTDGERYERFCPTRLDRLIEQALKLEQSIIKQKQILSNRLQGISKVLEM